MHERIATRDPAIGNVFERVADGWMLVTAGDLESFNTMTASWGCLGELWSRDVCIAFVRPQRYTRRFMDECSGFTLSFFPERFRPALQYCGSHSGREVDKVRETGLEPFEAAPGCVGFSQAELIVVARKIYMHDLREELFLDGGDIAAEVYPRKDFHRMYVGRIEEVLYDSSVLDAGEGEA